MNHTWVDLLACPACRGNLAATGDGSLRCTQCSRTFRQRDGVYDFLADVHPVVRAELGGIRMQDSPDAEFMARFASWLKTLDGGGDDFGPDNRSSPFLQNALHHRQQIWRLLDRYPLRDGAVVVELGADHCWASGIFIDRGARVVAVDISDHLRMAPRKDSAMLLRLKADMNALPLRDASADYVFANACVHHSWDLMKTFTEARRVLRPGGRFYLCSEPMPGMLRYLLFTVLGTFGRDEREMGINETLHRRSTWTRTAERAGFRPELVFPDFSRAEIAAKLRARRLPRFLAAAVVPFLKLAQVSIHMVATPRSASS